MSGQESDFASRWACQQQFLKFMQCFDCGDAEGAVGTVAPDVIWYRQGKKLTGPEAIRQVIKERPRTRTIRHHLSSIVVMLDGSGRAQSKAYYAAYAYDGEALPGIVRGPERIGDYHAEFVRIEGEWRIALLRAERLFVSAPGG